MQIQNNQLLIKSEDVGKEFLESLQEVIEIRKSRRLQYGDSYLEDDEIFLRLQIENKLKRLKINFENEKVSFIKEKRENALDSLKDLVNYSIFLISKINLNEK